MKFKDASLVVAFSIVVALLAACGAPPPTATAPPPTATAVPPAASPPTAEATSGPRTTENAVIHQHIPYVPGGDIQQKLSVYLPTGRESGSGTELPVVVLAHGLGSGKEDPPLGETMRFLNQLGIAAVTVDYRDGGANGNPWTSHNDAACGLAWIYVNAGTYGLDVDRMAAFGNSYGAQMLTNLALAPDPNLFLTDCPNRLPRAEPFRGVIPFGAAWFGVPGEGLLIPSEEGANIHRFIGGAETLEEMLAIHEELGKLSPAQWATSGELSAEARAFAQTLPAYWVHAGGPPFLLLYPGQDHNPQTEYDAFAALLDDVEVPYTYLVLPDAQHSAWGLYGETDPATWQEPVQQFLEEILAE